MLSEAYITLICQAAYLPMPPKVWTRACSLIIWDPLAACYLHAHQQCLNPQHSAQIEHTSVSSMLDELIKLDGVNSLIFSLNLKLCNNLQLR